MPRIPGAKDPDEFIKARGADAFRSLIERSEDHNAFRIEQIAAKYDLEDDEARVLFLRDAEMCIRDRVYSAQARHICAAQLVYALLWTATTSLI